MKHNQYKNFPDVTDFEEIKNTALIFLNLDYKLIYPALNLISHPFFDSTGLTISPNSQKVINILNGKDELAEATNIFKEEINRATTMSTIYMLLNKPYMLTFFKYTKDFYSIKDYGEWLSYIWTNSESPNNDVNCSISEITKWFKAVPIQMLMNEEELKTYNLLPETLTVYRGVARERNPKGISWTNNKEKAEWFAHRFDNNDYTGYIYEAEIKKSEILAYYSRMEEYEIVVNVPEKRKNVIKIA